MPPFKEKLCNDSGFNTVHRIGIRDMPCIAAERMLAYSRELLRQDHGRIQMLMKIGNTVGEQMRMARQLRLFQVPRHGNDIDRIGVCIAHIIRENDHRTDAALYAGIRMTAEIRKPDVAALRSVFSCVMLHRRSDIFSRVEAEHSVVFCFSDDCFYEP
mgnify:CR=1 FL=1